MKKYLKLTPIVALLLVASLFLAACESQRVSYTSGPFSREILEQNNLITETKYNNFHIRIVYPPVAVNLSDKQFISQYIQNFQEKKIFDELRMDRNLAQVDFDPNEQFYLAVYGYVATYRSNTVSLAFQVQFWSSKTKKTESWYTLNYNSSNQSIIPIESLFQNYAQVFPGLRQFVMEDLARQSTMDVVSMFNATEANSATDLLKNFVLIPSPSSPERFQGVRIYVSTNNPVTNANFGVANMNYAVNIPYATLEPYLLPSVRGFFRNEAIPLAPRNISEANSIIFPDLTDNF